MNPIAIHLYGLRTFSGGILWACSVLILSRMSTQTRLVTSDEPPYDIKGRVMPVRGTRPRFPPMIKKLWTAKKAEIPNAKYLPKDVFADCAITKPRIVSSITRIMIAVVPNNPNSSAIAVKMKSETATGTTLGLPRPGPVPKSPPTATAICA